MKIYFATDHAGYELKNQILQYVSDELGYEVEDCGAETYDPDDDYPDLIELAAKAIAKDPKNRKGIILGGSGQGEAIAANRMKGVRAAVYYGGALEIVTLAREHNDANVLSLGARFLNFEETKEVVRVWLETPFGGEERHARRIAKLDEI